MTRVHEKDRRPNKDHKFGETSHYTTGWFIAADGKRRPIAFTDAAIEAAMACGRRNLEDMPPLPWYVKLLDVLRWWR